MATLESSSSSSTSADPHPALAYGSSSTSTHISKEHEKLLDIFQGGDYLRFDNWYPDIREYTFETIIVPFPVSEAKALKKYGEAQQMLFLIREQQAREQAEERIKKSSSPSTEVNFSIDDENIAEVNASILSTHLTAIDREALSFLKSSLSSAIDPIVSKFGSAFIKTSSRSPKDAVFLLPKLYQLLADRVQKSKQQHPEKAYPETSNDDVLAFIRASMEALKITNVDEALDLFMNSRRIATDISMCELQLGEEKWDMNLIVREWKTELTPEHEFRAFVFHGHLTSCTQYWALAYVPELVEKKSEISSRIQSFWKEKLKERIHFAFYTIDFWVDPFSEAIWVVELNPIPPAAGTGLFDWNVERDRRIIENGPFELRVLENPLPFPLADIHEVARRQIRIMRGVEKATQRSRVRCDNCRITPIPSLIWHSCGLCGHFDLCEDCFSKGPPRDGEQQWKKKNSIHIHGDFKRQSELPWEEEEGSGRRRIRRFGEGVKTKKEKKSWEVVAESLTTLVIAGMTIVVAGAIAIWLRRR